MNGTDLERLLAEALPDGSFGGARPAPVTDLTARQQAANRAALEAALTRPRRRTDTRKDAA